MSKTLGSRLFLLTQGIFLLILFCFGLHFHLTKKSNSSTLLVQNHSATLNWLLKNKVIS